MKETKLILFPQTTKTNPPKPTNHQQTKAKTNIKPHPTAIQDNIQPLPPNKHPTSSHSQVQTKLSHVKQHHTFFTSSLYITSSMHYTTWYKQDSKHFMLEKQYIPSTTHQSSWKKNHVPPTSSSHFSSWWKKWKKKYGEQTE